MIQHLRINQISSSMTFDGTNIQRGCCSSPRNTEIWVCCFLCAYDSAIENRRRFEHRRVRNHVVASETKNSNELLHQFHDQVHDVVRVPSIFCRFSKQENTFRHSHKQECQSIFSVNLDEFFRRIIHRDRLFLLLRRMSFLSA